MPINRQLNIAVTFNCVQNADGSYGGSASYAQTGCNPSDMGTIVDSTGRIDFNQAATYDPAQFNESVNIQMTVAPQSTGYVTPVTWASQHGAGVTIIVPEGGSATEMQVVANANTPNVIEIIDKDDDSNTYNYKPAVELPDLNNYYISLDPQIVNRPRPNR